MTGVPSAARGTGPADLHFTRSVLGTHTSPIQRTGMTLPSCPSIAIASSTEP